MTLRRRIDRLEGMSPPLAQPLDFDLDLAPDLAQRIDAAQAAGTFPASLATDDIMAILHAARAQGYGNG